MNKASEIDFISASIADTKWSRKWISQRLFKFLPLFWPFIMRLICGFAAGALFASILSCVEL